MNVMALVARSISYAVRQMRYSFIHLEKTYKFKLLW